jgi:hypothetical protein
MSGPEARCMRIDVGATLVVAPIAGRVRLQRGDHKGRPYICHLSCILCPPSSMVRYLW